MSIKNEDIIELDNPGISGVNRQTRSEKALTSIVCEE